MSVTGDSEESLEEKLQKLFGYSYQEFESQKNNARNGFENV
jgi:hypothetical protein